MNNHPAPKPEKDELRDSGDARVAPTYLLGI